MYEKLLEPVKAGKIQFDSRFIMTPIKLGYAKDGIVNQRHIFFYERRAKHIPLLTTEPLYIKGNGKEIPGQLGIDSDDKIDGLSELVSKVHSAGSKIMAHINHAGRAANPKLTNDIVSASSVICPANQAKPRELSSAEIKDYIEAHTAAVKRAVAAGFDGVEIQFGHGYLIHQFLSPISNERTDEFGGSLSNRLKFGLEIVRRAREIAADKLLSVRLNAKDFVEGGLDIDDALFIAKLLKTENIDLLNITAGSMCESVPNCLFTINIPKGILIEYAARIKSETGLTTAVAGRINSPDIALSALKSGIDLIGMGRGFVVDPDYIEKIRTGRVEEIAYCAACHQGCLGELRKGRGLSCIINPEVGAKAPIEIRQTEHPKHVLIVGSGPAGLQAALLLSQMGHKVRIIEKNNYIGGQLIVAAKPKFKEDLLNFTLYYQNMIKRYGGEFILNTEATVDYIMSSKADAVIIATGSRPIIPDWPGWQGELIPAEKCLKDEISIENMNIALIGGGLVGLETALSASFESKSVTIFEMRPDVGFDMDPLAKKVIMNILKKNGVSIKTNTKVLQTDGRSVVTSETIDNEYEFDYVFIAMGYESENKLYNELSAAGYKNAYLIGDAKAVGKIIDAVRDATAAAEEIG